MDPDAVRLTALFKVAILFSKCATTSKACSAWTIFLHSSFLQVQGDSIFLGSLGNMKPFNYHRHSHYQYLSRFAAKRLLTLHMF